MNGFPQQYHLSVIPVDGGPFFERIWRLNFTRGDGMIYLLLLVLLMGAQVRFDLPGHGDSGGFKGGSGHPFLV